MKYHFFYGDVYSNWFGMDFKAPLLDFSYENEIYEDDENELVFSTSEQYMMVHKALFFEDFNRAEDIMSTREPREQKEFGRAVTPFDETKWNEVSRDIVYCGLYHKFTANDYIKGRLVDNDCDLFVEASPYDKIWGIGLGMKTPKHILNNPSMWKGTNWLGVVLTEVRNDIILGNFNSKRKWFLN